MGGRGSEDAPGVGAVSDLPFGPDEITANLVRHAGLDKHKARQCEAIVRQMFAAVPPPVAPEPADVPEGCTPADAKMLREGNWGLAQENHALREALRFYADKCHFSISDEMAWDTVSGEPQNFWCDEAGTAMVEDGWVAREALRPHDEALAQSIAEAEAEDAAAPAVAQEPAMCDADDPRFREAFEATARANNYGLARLGDGYRSSYTQAAYILAFGTVNRLLAAAPAVAQEFVDPTDPGYDVETLREHVRHLERHVRQLSAAPAVAQPQERSAKDYAIEHAEYMATAAEAFIEAIGIEAMARESVENDDEDADVPPPVAQEPAAWQFRRDDESRWETVFNDSVVPIYREHGFDVRPLYAAPAVAQEARDAALDPLSEEMFRWKVLEHADNLSSERGVDDGSMLWGFREDALQEFVDAIRKEQP